MATNGAYIVGCEGPRLTPDEAAFFRSADPWGFILFARNVETPDQVLALTEALRETVGRAAPVLIDQEGGRVQRLRAPHWRDWAPPLRDIEAAGPSAARAMYLRYRLIGAALADVGIDVNCVPCADVITDDTHPFLRDRCYGTDPDMVAEIARAAATGCLASGVLPVLKHIPGHGRGAADSHEALPVVDAAPETLAASDFRVFRELSDLPLGMTAHVVYSAYDDAPATVSRRMIRLVREEIGFDGLLMTDDISMGALGGAIGNRSAASMLAGCDVVLHCNGALEEMREVADSVGRMSATSQARADRALRLRRAPEAVDITALEAEFETLLTQ